MAWQKGKPGKGGQGGWGNEDWNDQWGNSDWESYYEYHNHHGSKGHDDGAGGWDTALRQGPLQTPLGKGDTALLVNMDDDVDEEESFCPLAMALQEQELQETYTNSSEEDRSRIRQLVRHVLKSRNLNLNNL